MRMCAVVLSSAECSILAARCKHWQTLLSLPADQLGGFHLDRDSPDGIDTLTFPSSHHHDGREPASVDAQHDKPHKQVFSYSIVLALLQYLYTDKLIVPKQFEKLADDEKMKTKAKKTKKHKKVEEDEEAEADETENQEDEEEAKKERLAWYRQLERAAKYFKIARLRRLCQRATRNRGFDVQVPSSSLGLDLRWLVEPQLQAFGVREPHCDDDDDDNGNDQAASFNSDHHTSKAPTDATEKQKAVTSNLRFAEMQAAMKKIEEEYAQSLERAHDRYLGQMQQALELYRSELSIEAVVLRTDHQAWARERARADASASAQRAAEAAELEAKERKAREKEEKRQAQIRREQEEQAKKNDEDRKRAKQEELARHREEKAKEKVGLGGGEESDLERQMVQERGADVKFLLGGECLWAHKLVITSSCEHFRLMFASGTLDTTRDTRRRRHVAATECAHCAWNG
jgi:hypothetical protein